MTGGQKTLSVIVPIYKVEDTLDRCIESIVAQKCSGMEIILVDDGSPDSCPAMCDEWALRDNSIRVIHKENGGLSDARNAGIDAAQGEFITFTDSDDYLSPHTYAPIIAYLQAHETTDIMEFPVSAHEGAAKQYRQTFKDAVFANAAEYWHQTEGWRHTYAWNKIYRRHLFSTERFPAGKVFEDMHTIPMLLNNCRHIATCSTGCYHYCYNSTGIAAKADHDAGAYLSLLEAHMKAIQIPAFALNGDERYYLDLVNIQIYAHEISGEKPVIPFVRFRSILSLKTILFNILGIRFICSFNRFMRQIIKRRNT